MIIFFALLTFISTFSGGFLGLKYRDKLHLILGLTAGILMGVVAFDIFPEIVELVIDTKVNPTFPMVALMIGFMSFHIAEKTLLIHHNQEEAYGKHKHPTVGILSSMAIIGHAFLDGIGIGMAFQISESTGLLVSIAVIAHAFSDGLNNVSLMLVHKNPPKKAFYFLILNAVAPILGVLSTKFFTFSAEVLLLYLGFFAGFLIYIGASDILPEAHSEKSSYKTILMTIGGAGLIFLVTMLR